MSKLPVNLVSALVGASCVFTASAGWAAVAYPPNDVPEPGMFGIIAAGMGGVLLAARLFRKN